jgi:hypothetical protein
MKLMDLINDGVNDGVNLKFEEFAGIRLKGATKISDGAKEKGGFSMLTYHHFHVKLPYYKRASEGKFDLEKSKVEYKEHLDKLCSMDKLSQVEFQKLVGIIEVLGELIIKHSK